LNYIALCQQFLRKLISDSSFRLKLSNGSFNRILQTLVDMLIVS
jgi:hypothetical protein